MPLGVHRLGELEHIYNKQNLKLKTNGSITLSSTQSSDHPFSSKLHDLDSLISSGTWVAGANRLWLHIEILFDDISVFNSSLSEVTEGIGVVLCNAELWSQLCLHASLTINDPNNLYITLSTRPSSNAQTMVPKLIPSTCIEKIDLSFHFSTCRRIRNASRAPFAVSGSTISHTLKSTNLIDNPVDRRYPSPLLSLGGYQETLMDECEPWTFPISSVGTSPVSSQDSVLSNVHSTSSLDGLATSHGYATQEVNLEILVQMMNSSLQTMMSGNKPVRPGGIVLSSDAGYPKLAAISPDLFSPGYVKAVSQRTALLPTIARSMSRVCSRTNSSGLTHRFKRLQEVSISNYSVHGSIVNSASSSTVRSPHVEALLWFLTRSKLVDPLACRRLKSLSASDRNDYGSHEILDESPENVEDAMLDEDDASLIDAYGAHDAVGLSQEHSLDAIAGVENDPLEDDLFWVHAQDEVAYDRMENFDNETDYFFHTL